MTGLGRALVTCADHMIYWFFESFRILDYLQYSYSSTYFVLTPNSRSGHGTCNVYVLPSFGGWPLVGTWMIPSVSSNQQCVYIGRQGTAFRFLDPPGATGPSRWLLNTSPTLEV